jgi:hypothetical protein
MANTLIDGLKERISNAITVNQSVGILLPGNNYTDLITALFEHMRSKPEDAWVYLSITRPYDNIVKEFKDMPERKNIKFIDCISRAAGIPPSEPNSIYIESPSLLEKIILEVTDIFRDLENDVDKYLIIDSLSSLLIYNDDSLVTEFFTHLSNRTRMLGIHTVSLVIEEETDESLNKTLYLKSDKIIKVRESFI